MLVLFRCRRGRWLFICLTLLGLWLSTQCGWNGAFAASAPRDCWIVYVNPVHHEAFAQLPFLVTEATQLDRNKKAPYAIYRAKIG